MVHKCRAYVHNNLPILYIGPKAWVMHSMPDACITLCSYLIELICYLICLQKTTRRRFSSYLFLYALARKINVSHHIYTIEKMMHFPSCTCIYSIWTHDLEGMLYSTLSYNGLQPFLNNEKINLRFRHHVSVFNMH